MTGATVPGKPCPQCQSVGSIVIAQVLAAKQLGEFSLAGAQMKTVATQQWTLTCTECGLHAVGHLENPTFDPATGAFTGGHFVGNPTHHDPTHNPVV